MNNLTRTVISTVIAAIVVLIVIFTMHQYTIEPRAIFLSATGKAMSPFQGKPVAYYPQNAPFNYTNVGVINLRYHTNNQSEDTQNKVFATLRELAAKAGGNGFVIDLNRTFLTPNPGPMQVFAATAQVISSKSNNSISQ